MSVQQMSPALNGSSLQRFDRDEIQADPIASEDSPGLSPLVLLSVFWRRKWIVLFFFVAGLLLGFFITIQRVSIYQSSAQILVTKKRQPTMSSPQAAQDGRVIVLEDFVATQLTLLKSDLILQNAAQKLQLVDPSTGGDLDQIAGMLGGGLDVARVPGAGGAPSGGNVVVLTFRSTSKEKCPHYLEAVIWGYSDFLKNKYDAATTAEIKQIDRTLGELDESLRVAKAEVDAANEKAANVSDENLDDLRKRVSSSRELMDTLSRQALSIASRIRQIKSIGPDETERKALLLQLSNSQNFGGALAPMDRARDIEVQILQLEAEKKKRELFVGKAHPDIVEIESKIATLREQAKLVRGLSGPGPSNANAEMLKLYELSLTAQQKNNVEEQEALRAILDRDVPNAMKLTKLTDIRNGYEERKKNAAAQREQLQLTKRNLESTRESGGYDATVISPPMKSPVMKVEPNPVQGTMMGGVLFLLVGFGFAGLAEFFDKTFHSPDEIRRRLGRFVIGHIPSFSRPELPEPTSELPAELPVADPSLICYHAPRSRESEAIRGLRTSLYFSTFGRGHQVIQMTSPNPGDGKSTIVSNLAISIAQSGKKTILIDADFRKPRLHRLFPKINNEHGLSSVLIREKELHEVIQESGIPNLYILPVGIRPKNPGELISSALFHQVIDRIRDEYEFVLLDTPPLLAVSDPAAIATRVDGVLLVIRIRPKIRPAAERANDMLSSLGANVLGVIVNSAQVGGNAAGYGGYGSGYNYGYNYGYGYSYNYKYNYDYEYSEVYAAEDDAAAAVPNAGAPNQAVSEAR